MVQENNSERRSSPRLALKLPLKIDANTKASLVNISDGGMCFLTGDQSLAPNNLVHIRVGEKKTLISARVRWIATFDQVKGGLLCGAAFENLNDESRQEIERLKKHGVSGSA